MRKELEKVRQKQDVEMSSLQARMNSAYSEFKKNRALEFDRLLQKYKNRINEMEKLQKLEVANFSKILKGSMSSKYRYINI